jgi:hypothetical protein
MASVPPVRVSSDEATQEPAPGFDPDMLAPPHYLTRSRRPWHPNFANLYLRRTAACDLEEDRLDPLLQSKPMIAFSSPLDMTWQ